jgi:hypothetical protein
MKMLTAGLLHWSLKYPISLTGVLSFKHVVDVMSACNPFFTQQVSQAQVFANSCLPSLLVQHYYFYHLWHPLDHVESGIRIKPSLKPFLDKGSMLESLVHERYRNPKNFTLNRHYEVNGWFTVQDPISNSLKNRLVMTMPVLGVDVSRDGIVPVSSGQTGSCCFIVTC